MATVMKAPEGGRWVAYKVQRSDGIHYIVYLHKNGFLVRETNEHGFIDASLNLMLKSYPGIEIREW